MKEIDVSENCCVPVEMILIKKVMSSDIFLCGFENQSERTRSAYVFWTVFLLIHVIQVVFISFRSSRYKKN